MHEYVHPCHFNMYDVKYYYSYVIILLVAYDKNRVGIVIASKLCNTQ